VPSLAIPNSQRRIASIVIAVLLSAGGPAAASAETPGPDPDDASCLGLGSSFYAHFATGQRALVAHLVKDEFSSAPGEHYRVFAQEKEGGSIPAPCGSRLE
jgi:hypothetical protein